MRKITAYITEDGKVFETKTEAQNHERFLRLHERLLNNPLYGDRDGAKVEPETLIEWINANTDLVRWNDEQISTGSE